VATNGSRVQKEHLYLNHNYKDTRLNKYVLQVGLCILMWLNQEINWPECRINGHVCKLNQ
jgi:hypothetical protein